jgi:hypothetical protein
VTQLLNLGRFTAESSTSRLALCGVAIPGIAFIATIAYSAYSAYLIPANQDLIVSRLRWVRVFERGSRLLRGFRLRPLSEITAAMITPEVLILVRIRSCMNSVVMPQPRCQLVPPV